MEALLSALAVYSNYWGIIPENSDYSTYRSDVFSNPFKIKGPPFSTELEALFTKHDIFLLLSEFHNSNYTMKNTQSYAENE